MPLSRYKLRNEYRLGDPNLYGVADRDDSGALLEGVAMAGLVGVLRQLGDLAEFAAEIFHDLHEEVMSTTARGYGLMTRVHQLEADFLSIEKAILSQTNHSRFTYNPGAKWHPNLCLDQNIITQGDLPRFIMDSYEECRGPPRLFLLDKFDIAGDGACLKRYSDPSVFRTEFVSSGVKRIEVKREKKFHKVKKKGTKWWNEEPPEIFTVLDFNVRLRMASDENISEKTPAHGVKLKRRHLNGSSFNSRSGKSYMEQILEMYLPESVPEPHEIHMDALTKRLLCKEKDLPNRQDILQAPMVELDKYIMNSLYLEAKPIPVADYDIEEISSTFNQAQKDVLTNGEEVSADGCRCNESDLEKASSIFQLVDQKDELVDRESMTASGADECRSEDATSELNTAMVSEMEADTNIQVKHKPGFNITRQVDSCIRDEHQELCAASLESYSVKNSSVASHDWSGSLENQQSDCSDLDSISSSADLHASLDMPEDFELSSLSEQAVLGLSHDDQYLKPADKLKSFSDGEVAPNPYFSAIHGMPSENLSNDSNILGSGSLKNLREISHNDVPDASGHIPELGELPSTSCITGSTSSLDASWNGDQLDVAEFSLGSLDFYGEPSCPEVGKQLVDDNTHPVSTSNLPSEINESSQSIQPAEICCDGSSNSLQQSSDILDWSHGMKDDNDMMQKVILTENVKDCSAAETARLKILDHISDDLPVTDMCDLHFGTNDDDIEKAPKECIEEGSGDENALCRELDPSHLMKEPVVLTKQHPNAFSVRTPKKTCLTNVRSAGYLSVRENRFPSENSEYLSPAINFPKVDGFQVESDKMTSRSIILEFSHSYDVGLLGSHVEGSPTKHSGKEALSSHNQVNDEPVVEGNHLHNAMKTSSLHVELSSMVMLPCYTVNAPAVVASTQSDVGARGILENDSDDHVPDPTSFPEISGNNIEVRDACFSSKIASDVYEQQSSKASNQENLVGSENELSPPIVASTGPDLVPCTPDSNASIFLDHVHHPAQIHLHPSNDNSEAFMTSTNSGQESELRSPCYNENDVPAPTIFPLNSAIISEKVSANASEQTLEVHDAKDHSTVSENEVEHTPEYSKLQCKTAPSLEQIGSHELKKGISSPCNHEFDILELPDCSPYFSTSAALTSFFPAISLTRNEMISQGSFEQQPYLPTPGFEQQPHQPTLCFPMTGTNPLQANLEEMPPPPPLPPLAWRRGKLQYGSLFSGPEMIHGQSSLLQIPTTENQNARLCFSNAQVSPKSLDSALVQTTKGGAAQHVLQTLFGEMPQHSKSSASLPFVEVEEPQHGLFTLGKEMVPPRSSSAPLPTVEDDEKNHNHQENSQQAALDGESQHMLQNLVREKPQPSELFTPLPIVEVDKPQCSFLTSREKMLPPYSSSTLLKSAEEAKKESKPQDGSPTIKGETSQLYAIPPVKEDDKLQNSLLTSDGKRMQRSISCLNFPIVEHEKSYGNVQDKLTQQTDPSIVSFHNRITLRKVSERVQPEVKPMADERNSFLEQIRSKSFNLKPAVVKKPSLQGPKTNLNVIAILEKANSIRQAFVGSDEDDDDNWSDS